MEAGRVMFCRDVRREELQRCGADGRNLAALGKGQDDTLPTLHTEVV